MTHVKPWTDRRRTPFTTIVITRGAHPGGGHQVTAMRLTELRVDVLRALDRPLKATMFLGMEG